MVDFEDGKRGRDYGLNYSRSVESSGKNVFIGGMGRLAWFTFDGKELSIKKFWVDDAEPPGHTFENVVPYIDTVVSMAASKNGKYLFFAAGKNDLTGVIRADIIVLKIG